MTVPSRPRPETSPRTGDRATVPVPTSSQRRRGISAAMKETYLEALRAGWTHSHAAELVGRNRRRFQALRETDETFRAAVEEALEAGTDALEDEIRRRAVDGWLEETIEGDQLVRQVRRYDPRLLMYLHGRRRPPEAVHGSVTIVIESAFPGVSRHADIELEPVELPALPAGSDDDR